MVDKYKVASDLKKNNHGYTHKKAIEISKEAVKIYFDEKCTIDEAVEKAKEVIR